MQIAAIQSIAPISSSIAPAVKSKPASAVPQSTTTAAAKAPASASTSGSTTSAKTSGSGGGSSHGSGQQTSSSSSSEAVAATYSTTVNGKTYSGSVELTDGEYTVSVANLPGASASGSSVQSAENNLGAVIDALV
jgi:hypothetical protein